LSRLTRTATTMSEIEREAARYIVGVVKRTSGGSRRGDRDGFERRVILPRASSAWLSDVGEALKRVPLVRLPAVEITVKSDEEAVYRLTLEDAFSLSKSIRVPKRFETIRVDIDFEVQ
jgi:hypothetical protein